MKRFLCLLISIMLTLLCACTPQDETIRTPVNFYYLTSPVTYDSPDGAISLEIREAAGYENDIAGLLNMYLIGPKGADHSSPFPSGTAVVCFIQAGNSVEIHLNRQFGRLTGFDLTAACACLAMTVADITTADTILIRAENTTLDGKQSITIRTSDLIFWDTAVQPQHTS